MAMNLTEFLTARIEDDEAIARAFVEFRSRVDCFTPEATDFVERFDPARVLAECEAKRRIIGRWHETARPYSDSRQQEIHETLDEEVLPLLALPYADRPGYRDEWRPDA